MLRTQSQPQSKTAPDASRVPLQAGVLQRKCDCGQHTIAGSKCSSCSEERKGSLQRSALSRDSTHGHDSAVPPIVHDVLNSPGQPLDAATRAFFEPRFDRDFSRVPASSNAARSQAATTEEFNNVDFQTPPTPATPAAPPVAAPLALSPTVDRITVVDGSTGATTGYPAILGNSDLNVPGPFNYAATGEVKNVHQIKFHLDQGNSSALTPTRIVKATFTRGTAQAKYPADQPGDPGGFAGTRTQSDGPPAHEIKRPTSDTIVIADSPGPRSLGASDYPFGLSADFILTVAAAGTDIARIKYGVRISKTTATNIPNTQNTVSATDKEDIARGRSLI